VDEPAALTALLEAISDIAREIPMVFPCHPRTRKQINDFGLDNLFADPNWINPGFESGILLLEPLDYIDFLSLWKDCTAVLTDSGGLQEETTALKIPCLTMRENTERPITLEIGSNTLVGQDTDKLKAEIDKILKGEKREGAVPELWDGRASERIVSVLDS
jgi:UDP-N-acetylglucosamine 2-epimerase (non-hydrolysing)